MRKTRMGMLTLPALALLVASNMGGCPLTLSLLGAGLLLSNNTGNTNTTGDTNTGDTNNTGDTGDTGDTGNTGDTGDTGDTGTAKLNVVKTSISVRHDAGLQCGDDLIAFGTGSVNGVAWIKPSAGDTTARTIANSDQYSSNSFAVAKDKIYLIGGPDDTFQMTVYDTSTDTATSFPTTDIRVRNIVFDPRAAGHPQASGDYCVMINDEGDVSDGKMLKLIDCTGATPAVTSFETNPASSNAAIDQVAIDADTHTVVAVVGDDIYVYDIMNPSAAPTMWTVGAGFGLSDTPVHISGDYMICGIRQSTGPDHAALVKLSDGTVTKPDGPESAGEYALGGNKYAFFADATADDSNGSDRRAAVGTVPNAANTKATIDDFIDGSTTNNGIFGYGQTSCITPDGKWCFIAGNGSIGSGEFLRWSTDGSAWNLPADPDGSSQYGVPGTDVACSDDCVAFKSGNGTTAGTSTVLGYAILDGGSSN